MRNLVIVDDIDAHLQELATAVAKELNGEQPEIRRWAPAEKEDSKANFDRLVDEETILVVTDYDLTSNGRTGLFGSSIVAWCQARAIPVGALPSEPNQYEIRIPTDADKAGKYIAGVYRGFRQIRSALEASAGLLEKKSPIAVLAEILERPREENQLALYGMRLASANAALLDQINAASPANVEPSVDDKKKLLCYVVGHLLLNVILRFPGPILNQRALAAYVAVNASEEAILATLFKAAQYNGPFCDVEPYYWLSDVDSVLNEMTALLPSELSPETRGELHREAIELRLGKKLPRPECNRCNGVNGGFLCPFTQRTVCQLPYCSVGSSGWIPQGARLCRIEKDFYDEWAPMLGF
jgi:hypothetical protein